jgi:excisionase family DNA binding protein
MGSRPEPERRAMRVREAAIAYGVGRTTLHELIRKGRLVSVKVGGIRLIPVEALEALITPE